MKYEEVAFRNERGLELAGMLFLPESYGPYPAAVLIHGSGPSRRDNRWYLGMTESLLAEGIAVLLPDKRGSESSEGEWRGADIPTLAADTTAAVQYLNSRGDLPISGIGVIGMSQGGWIAPVVASGQPEIAWVVSFSGSPTTMEEQLRHEEYHNIKPYTYGFIARLISHLAARSLLKNEILKPLADFDPLPYWKDVDVPVLFAFGGADRNVPVESGILRLEESGLTGYEVVVYPKGDHGIVDDDTARIHRPTMERVVGFIKETAEDKTANVGEEAFEGL